MSPIISLLNEVEAALYDIRDAELATWAQERCEKIRDALMAKDSAAAAWEACQLGEQLAEIRQARRLESEGVERGWQRRSRERTSERRAVFEAERKRCFSDTVAYERTAEKLGKSVKTIRRALKDS